MSTELTKARQQLSMIRTYLRQGKPQPAVQALYSTVAIILKTPLMKTEREEFERLLDDAVYCLTGDAEVKKIYPIKFNYEPGKERQLLDGMRDLLEAFDSTIKDEAQDYLRMLEERRQNLLKDGETLLEKGDIEGANQVLKTLAFENKDDSELWGLIGEMYLKAGQFEEAITYLEKALQMSPELAHLYNKIGMALRKVKKFETAEKYYLIASSYLGRDANLFFNLGRLYVDWGQWAKAIKSADAAISLEPSFDEARKLGMYARKMKEKEEQENIPVATDILSLD